jgi:hypothetical protein
MNSVQDSLYFVFLIYKQTTLHFMIKDVFYFENYNRLFEAEESQSKSEKTESKGVFSVGDVIEYRTRKYDDDKKTEEQEKDAIAQGEIKKVIRGGKKYRVYNKNIDREFTKMGEDIIGKPKSKEESDESGSASVKLGDETLLEKIYSNKVYKFGTI